MTHLTKLAAASLLMLAACGGGNVPAPEQAGVMATGVRSGGQPASAAASGGAVPADYTDVLQKIFVGYFGRPADPGGLAFFANNYLGAGAPTDIVGMSNAYASNASVRALIDSFGSSQESQDLYPGDNLTFMTAIYKNLFNRVPDAAGQAFWVNALNTGAVTRAGAVLAIMAGTQSTDTTIVNNKAAVATSFTASLNTPTLVAAYSGLAANAIVRSTMNSVTQNTSASDFQGAINATLVTLTGQQPVVSTVVATGLALLSPRGLSVDRLGNIFVASAGNHTVQQISSGKVVITGVTGVAGAVDGAAGTATFNSPRGTAVDSAGNVYVADLGNNKIRRIDIAGVTSTFAGSGVAGSVDGTGAGASFNAPSGVAIDGAGNLYVSELLRVRKISPAGVVTTLAGSGQAGKANGAGGVASFNNLGGIAVDGTNNVYVSDTANNLIRKITPAGLVSTLAGNGISSAVNGTGSGASFSAPLGLAIDSAGNVLVADLSNNLIRKIAPDGTVTTLAGSGQSGGADGISPIASFSLPAGVALDRSGTILVVERGGNRVRSIAPAVAAAPSASAEGAYAGKLTGGVNTDFQMLVLENGDYWSLYGTTTASGALLMNGFVQGTGVSANGVFSTANVKDFGFAPALDASASVSYNAALGTVAGQIRSVVTGTLNFSGGPVTPVYNYASKPPASVLTGNWSMNTNTGETMTLTFGQAGAYSALSSGGCRFAGTITPRLSGKNLYDVTGLFGAAPCVLVGQRVVGIAVPVTLPGGQTQLSLFGVDGTRQFGFWASGAR